ncbi:hypothetical protein ACH5RR_021765 [Cinchona calisaya]|uniref:Uncharacterized protein n=1 Tax=Cinchona calisaya TaxID=153742 RepID=A0ABD2ZK02_9GENT
MVELKSLLEEKTKKYFDLKTYHTAEIEKLKKESEQVAEDLCSRLFELDSAKAKMEKLKSDPAQLRLENSDLKDQLPLRNINDFLASEGLANDLAKFC